LKSAATTACADLRSSNEVIVGYVHSTPDFDELGNDAVNIFIQRYASFLRDLNDFERVFVGSCGERTLYPCRRLNAISRRRQCG